VSASLYVPVRSTKPFHVLESVAVAVALRIARADYCPTSTYDVPVARRIINCDEIGCLNCDEIACPLKGFGPHPTAKPWRWR
jgi:hypothetical protein